MNISLKSNKLLLLSFLAVTLNVTHSNAGLDDARLLVGKLYDVFLGRN